VLSFTFPPYASDMSDKLQCDYITATQKADIGIQYRT